MRNHSCLFRLSVARDRLQLAGDTHCAHHAEALLIVKLNPEADGVMMT